MYHGMISDVAIKNTDERVKAILGNIDYMATEIQTEYKAIQFSSSFWRSPGENIVDLKFPDVNEVDVYKAVFRALLEVFGIFEQTKTYYELHSRPDIFSDCDNEENEETNNG